MLPRYGFPEWDYSRAMDYLKLDDRGQIEWFTPKFNHIYALKISNGTVKIGITKNVKKRAMNVATGSGLKVLRVHHTAKVQVDVARNIERQCHETFAEFRTNGEFFKIKFEDACTELDKYADFIAETNRKLREEIIPAQRKDYEEYIAKHYGSKNSRPSNVIQMSKNTLDVDNLTRIDYHGVRVMTTAQLANHYKCKVKQIQQNFNNNKAQFKEGEHYYKLEGAELQAFRLQINNINPQISQMTRTLYLWTYSGAVHHCKLLNTPEAWQMFRKLEDAYFGRKSKHADPPPEDNPDIPLVDNRVDLLNEIANLIETDPKFKNIVKSMLK